MKSNSYLHSALLASGLALLAAAPLSADVLFSDNFDSYANGTALADTSTWTRRSYPSTVPASPLSVNNGAVTFGGASIGIEAVYVTLGPALTTGNSLYAGFDFTVNSIGTTISSLALNNFFNTETPSGTPATLALKSDETDSYQLAARLLTNNYFGDTLYEVGETYRVVMGYTKLEANLGRLDVYVNDVLIATGIESSGWGVDSFALRQSNGDYSATYDNLIIATTYAEAAAVPEPATYAAIFGGLALVGVMLARRRRATGQ